MRVLALVLILVLTVVSAAASMQGVDDDQIYDLVRRRLASDPDVRGGALDITVKEGIVTLRGVVRSEKARKKADKLARKVKGVKSVVNELTVRPAGL